MPIYQPKAFFPSHHNIKGNLPAIAEQLKGVFKMHDRNGDGRLDRAELKEAFKYLGAWIPAWRAARGLKNADANGDGFITEDEMTSLVNYAIQFGYTVN